jgi:TRAP transporter 4TM/12TM fusion protein
LLSAKGALGISESKSILETLKEKGILQITVTTLCVLIALFHIVTSYIGALEALRHRSVHLTFFLMITFLVSSLKRKQKGYLVLNIVFSLLALMVGAYVYIQGPEIPGRLGEPIFWDYAFGTIIIFLTLEAARRVVGLAISILTLFSLIYTYFGLYFPGFFKHPGYSFSEMINAQFLDMVGLWGIPLGTMATFIIIFLIFAGLLMQTGMVDVFIDLANKMFGTRIGGPAKVAIVSSTLMGSISGSAAANVLVTGTVSIPTMKKLGYSPTFAGAVEASVSSGGQFMPPIMGASAFIIASILGIAYIEVCKAAILPALLWFFSFYVMVHFEAKRLGLARLSREDLGDISVASILKRLYLFIPLLLLVFLLIVGYSPMYAGFICVITLLGLSFIRKETRFNLSTFCAGLESGIKSALPVSMACAAAGILVGAVMQSGLGYMLSGSLVSIAHGQMILILPLVLFASLILGMGMTTVGAYIIVATLVSPALVDMGVVPIAAHFFPFYFAIISAITPPVAVAAYAASGISGADPFRTGVTAFKLALPALCVPFVFVTQPGLLIIGGVIPVLFTFGKTLVGIICFSSGVTGYQLRRLAVFERIFLIISALMLFYNKLWINMAGLCLLCIILLMQKVFFKKNHP